MRELKDRAKSKREKGSDWAAEIKRREFGISFMQIHWSIMQEMAIHRQVI